MARLALRYNCRVVPVRVERLKGVRFRLTFEEPMEVTRTGDDAADALALMTRINLRARGMGARAARPLVLAASPLAGLEKFIGSRDQPAEAEKDLISLRPAIIFRYAA